MTASGHQRLYIPSINLRPYTLALADLFSSQSLKNPVIPSVWTMAYLPKATSWLSVGWSTSGWQWSSALTSKFQPSWTPEILRRRQPAFTSVNARRRGRLRYEPYGGIRRRSAIAPDNSTPLCEHRLSQNLAQVEFVFRFPSVRLTPTSLSFYTKFVVVKSGYLNAAQKQAFERVSKSINKNAHSPEWWHSVAIDACIDLPSGTSRGRTSRVIGKARWRSCWFPPRPETRKASKFWTNIEWVGNSHSGVWLVDYARHAQAEHDSVFIPASLLIKVLYSGTILKIPALFKGYRNISSSTFKSRRAFWCQSQ